MKHLKRKSLYIIILVSLIISFIYGEYYQHAYIGFINCLSLISFIILFMALIRWAWIKGDFTFFSWKPIHGSYNKWREGRVKERKEATNIFFLPGILLLIISIILSATY